MIAKILALALLFLTQPRPMVRCTIDPCDTTRLICVMWERDGMGELHISQYFSPPIQAPFESDPAQCKQVHSVIFYDPYSDSRILVWWWYENGEPMVSFREIYQQEPNRLLDV